MGDSASLIDTSVWVALAFPTHPRHTVAVSTFEQRSDERPAVFCRATQQSFLRIAKTPTILNVYGASATTNRDAWVLMDRFSALTDVEFREEPSALFSLWRDLTVRGTASPKLWMDAYLAAFAIRADLQLLTLDKAFRQFKGLNVSLL